MKENIDSDIWRLYICIYCIYHKCIVYVYPWNDVGRGMVRVHVLSHKHRCLIEKGLWRF